MGLVRGVWISFLLGSEVDNFLKFWSKHQMQWNSLDWIFKTPSHQEHMILSSNMFEKTYLHVSLKEFLKLFNCLASSSIHTVSGWLDLLFKSLHQEIKRREERILTRLAWVPPIVVVLPPIYRHLVWGFFIKTLIIVSICTNIHRPYVCDLMSRFLVKKT